MMAERLRADMVRRNMQDQGLRALPESLPLRGVKITIQYQGQPSLRQKRRDTPSLSWPTACVYHNSPRIARYNDHGEEGWRGGG